MSWAHKYPAERLAVHNAAWEGRYAEVSADLLKTLGSDWVVEHVGSTSVPGLVAKPVIDLTLRLPEGWEMSDACASLLRAGWTAPVVVGHHWATYLLNNDVRVAIGHIFSAGQWSEAIAIAWDADPRAQRVARTASRDPTAAAVKDAASTSP